MDRDLKSIENLLLGRQPLLPLKPKGVWREDLRKAISVLPVPPLHQAGLHLWNDDIASCHELAQAHETPVGNHWHAILHRREGDFGNARYWYQHIGKTPVWTRIRKVYPKWDPISFLEWCQERASPPPAADLEAMQSVEMRALLEASRAKRGT